MARCIFTVREMRSPIMDDPRGFRLLFASPNMAGVRMTPAGVKRVPSFDKPYYITHFGDYTDMADVLQQAHKAGAILRKMGFGDMEAV